MGYTDCACGRRTELPPTQLNGHIQWLCICTSTYTLDYTNVYVYVLCILCIIRSYPTALLFTFYFLCLLNNYTCLCGLQVQVKTLVGHLDTLNNLHLYIPQHLRSRKLNRS